MQISTIGLDIAKNVFQVHGIDAKEKVVARKQLRRERGEPAGRGDPGHRCHRGERDRGDGSGPDGFSVGARFCGLDRTGAATGSTGGKQKLGPISKQGDRYLRRILVVGAHSVLRRAKQNPEKYLWLTQLLARRPFKVVAVALANKMARMAWALLAHGGTYRAPVLAAAA